MSEDKMTITETAPDGTETVIEITSTKPDDTTADDDKTLVEEVVEALFDTDADDDADELDTATDDAGDPAMYELTPTEEEISTNSVEFTVGEDMFPATDVPSDTVETPIVDVPETGYSAAAPDYSTVSETDTSAPDAEALEQQAHADAANDAQAAADEFVAQGDYAAAAEAREVAENEAWEAGDQSMLGASDSSDLDNAAYKQDVAADYRVQQAEHIAEGDFAAAKEDAQNAGYATGDADYLASGDDHTGQADNDEYNLDWAVHQEKNADYNAQQADAYAAEGDLDNAQIYADRAEDYAASAGDFASQGDPNSVYNDVDPSSTVASGETYDSTYDASAVDTGFDAGADTAAASTYDTTTDDVS